MHPAVIAGMLVDVMSFTTAMPDEHVAERLKELFDEYLSLTMKLLEQRRAKLPAEELKRMDDMRLAMLKAEQKLEINPIAVALEKEETYLENLTEVEPIHSVVEIARQNHGVLPMAVASGGTQRIIDLVLDRKSVV